MKPHVSWQAVALLLIVAVIVAVALFVDPIPQDPAYHAFVDRRGFLGMPNFLNVMSNLPFVIVGAWGIAFVVRFGADVVAGTRAAWLVFFGGVFLTAFGSGYYHFAPGNDTLVWDRLPMTIGFMSFVAIVIAEYLSVREARAALLPLLLLGAASVFYWAHTEALGAGDLRPYAIVQFLPMLAIPFVVLALRSRSDLGPYIGWMIGFYFTAKLLEYFDSAVYSAGAIVSGHSLKHVAASLAPASLLYGLMRRRYHAARTHESTESNR